MGVGYPVKRTCSLVHINEDFIAADVTLDN